MTKMHTYLIENKLSQREFSSRIRVDQSIVSRLSSGEMKPSLALAVRIERATMGEIPVESWVESPADAAEEGGGS